MTGIPLLDHELADDELKWMADVWRDFSALRAAAAGDAFNPREALRSVLARPEYKLPTPIDLSGDGVWRGGCNRHGRYVAGVFLKTVELHRHNFSRTDQFPMYMVGEAEAYAEDANGVPFLVPVTGGDHFHNDPGAPHAFLPKTGKPVNADWEIAFIAITPRNLREDTHRVTDASLAKYERIVGRAAPEGV